MVFLCRLDSQGDARHQAVATVMIPVTWWQMLNRQYMPPGGNCYFPFTRMGLCIQNIMK